MRAEETDEGLTLFNTASPAGMNLDASGEGNVIVNQYLQRTGRRPAYPPARPRNLHTSSEPTQAGLAQPSSEHHHDYTATTTQRRLHNHDYTTTTTQPRLQHHDYTTTTTQPRLHNHDYTTTITAPRLHNYDYTTMNTQPRLHNHDYTTTTTDITMSTTTDYTTTTTDITMSTTTDTTTTTQPCL